MLLWKLRLFFNIRSVLWLIRQNVYYGLGNVPEQANKWTKRSKTGPSVARVGLKNKQVPIRISSIGILEENIRICFSIRISWYVVQIFSNRTKSKQKKKSGFRACRKYVNSSNKVVNMGNFSELFTSMKYVAETKLKQAAWMLKSLYTTFIHKLL